MMVFSLKVKWFLKCCSMTTYWWVWNFKNVTQICQVGNFGNTLSMTCYWSCCSMFASSKHTFVYFTIPCFLNFQLGLSTSILAGAEVQGILLTERREGKKRKKKCAGGRKSLSVMGMKRVIKQKWEDHKLVKVNFVDLVGYKPWSPHPCFEEIRWETKHWHGQFQAQGETLELY